MAGAVMNPVQAIGSMDMPNGRTLSSSSSDTLRISSFVDRLLALTTGARSDSKEICRLCVSLSRSRIDNAVGNNEIPDRASVLPYLLKQVCQWTNDTNIQTAIMVLMISVKGACTNGWFSEKDNEEVHILWSEMAASFCSVRDMNSGESTVHHSISTVMSRFYPRMKMGKIFAFIEAMPGYGALVKDFQITKNANSPDEKVYLFVAQADNTETSSCITSPQLVNFLLNGKAVDRRTCIYKDPGPQIPTNVTDLVKYGTNLLQAVGQFNGKYVIVVAFMSMITDPSCPVLPNYAPPVAAASDSDNDIVEGPSRISLNCPISFKRITTPVKGHLCKHLQCFDFDNYVDINSRRPSWRCPHCSQSVCFTDIRIDQGMAKVLKEVGDNISHVKFSADGSWEAFNECDDHADKQEKSFSHKQPTPSSDTGVDIMDLTEGDNDIDASNSNQENEKKPSLAQFDQPNPGDQIPSHVNMNPVHTNIAPQMENQFFRLPYETVTSDTRSHVTISQGQTVISGSNNMQLSTHAIGASNTFMNPILQGQSQTHISASSMQFQQHSLNSMSNDYGLRYTTPNRHVTRIPNAVQALPVQTPAGMVSDGRRQQFSRSQMDRHQMSMIAASMSENMGSQSWVHHDLSNVSTQPAQQFGVHSGPSHQSSGHHFNSYRQLVNHTISNSVQSPFVGPAIGQVSNQQAHHYARPTTGSISNQQTHHYANSTAPQAFRVGGWTPPVPAPLQTSLSSTPVISSEEQTGVGQASRMQEGSANVPADQNWRPTGRMRGSLSGRAYSEAFSRSIVHPTQPVLAASPPVLNTPRPFIPHHLQVLMANNLNANGFEDGAGGSVLDGNGGAGSFA
ncbi:hypothetical protein L1987_02917 [Smallanthus sonchifolius]|uniref:Uncharacterized protein n=1 Tax=Smallanthus sonchifolius TaxID=185202 RepID=A0ACB9K977_9ASTR|nr:hypothetical protein L1987_02917 [Smallanthus sonchifolius]